MSSTVTAPGQLAACRRVSVIHRRGASSVSALLEVDFSIEPGERVSLFGVSGSGKTTLLHVLAGLMTPDDGEVWWRGTKLSSLDAAARGGARAAGIALVFQGANLLPSFTAFENVAFAEHARLLASGPPDDELEPADLLGLVGLADKLDALPGELSGGEAQRVAIARALAQRPQLLLCDEPTGQLDSDTGSRVLDLIDAVHGRFGFAQVTATHDANLAARYDRSIGLADGRILTENRHS